VKRRTSTTRLEDLTASERAFEADLAAFGTPAASAPSSASGDRSSADDAFIDDLFARRAALLDDDRYRNIEHALGFNTKIAGISFDGRQDAAAGMSEGDPLVLRRIPDHDKDPNAIAVEFGRLQLGYLNRNLAKRLAPLMDGGAVYRASVKHVTGGGERHRGINIWVERVDGGTAARPSRRAASAEVDEAAILRALIGDRELRQPQRDVLAHVTRGRNTLAIMGTGRGKSVCFQYPAACGALARRMKTLVIYPLRALANDQFAALDWKLSPLGIDVYRANGSIGEDERAMLTSALETGSWHMILATPEFVRYHAEAFGRDQNRPDLVVIDECHHVYESRQRPAYAEIAQTLAQLGNPQVLALTATANDGETARRTARMTPSNSRARFSSDPPHSSLRLFTSGERNCESR